MNSYYKYVTDTANGIEKLRKAIVESEAVVIGAGAGLSTSAGFTYTGERLQKYFGDFVAKYDMPDMYSGGFMVMRLNPEESWAYWSRYIFINRYMNPPKPVYDELLNLVRNKEYFVVTTNVDHCFQKAGFDKHRLFYTQGDYGLWQCSKPCHNKTYDNEEGVKKMILAQGFVLDEDAGLHVPEKAEIKMKIPSDLIPICPVCGEPMTMNLRADETFVQDEGWYAAEERYSAFLKDCHNKKTLFLELGIGANTPGVIKIPFIRMTNEREDVTYACLNYGEAFAPKEIANKSICINGDIGKIIKDINT